MSSTTAPVECPDERCEGGLIPHDACNGFGFLTMGGKRYRKRNGLENLGKSTTKQGCEGCGGLPAIGGAPAKAGHGLVACGCTDLGLIPGTMTPCPGVSVDLDELTGPVDMGPQWDTAGAA